MRKKLRLMMIYMYKIWRLHSELKILWKEVIFKTSQMETCGRTCQQIRRSNFILESINFRIPGMELSFIFCKLTSLFWVFHEKFKFCFTNSLVLRKTTLQTNWEISLKNPPNIITMMKFFILESASSYYTPYWLGSVMIQALCTRMWFVFWDTLAQIHELQFTSWRTFLNGLRIAGKTLKRYKRIVFVFIWKGIGHWRLPVLILSFTFFQSCIDHQEE